MNFDLNNIRIGVVGLGYVGLPLAVEFGRRFPTVGFDINDARIAELEGGSDSTLEVSPQELAAATLLSYTSNVSALSDCNFYVVTVPTPISRSKRPDLMPLRNRRILRALPGAGLGPAVQRRLFRRLQPGAHQPWRQGTSPDDDPESDLRLDT